MVVNFYTDIQLIFIWLIYMSFNHQSMYFKYFYNHNGLKKKHKRADTNNIHSEIIKKTQFQDFH